MSQPVVCVTLQQFGEHDDAPRRLLEDAGCRVRYNTLGRRLQRDELPQWLQGAHAVIAGVEPYDAEVLARLPHLQCISRCGVGTDTIDLAAARARGIVIHTTPDEVAEPVAQMTVAMIMALARNLSLHQRDMEAGRWEKRLGHLLSEWTVGLIGFGRIGRAVERYLRVFGPRILVTDPALGDGGEVPAGVQVCALPALLDEADVVSLHASCRRADGPLLGRQEFARMPRGSFVVNTARGWLMDEAALHAALVEGRLAGAALDVFAEEPYAGALARLPNVVCTPHVATLTRASRAAMERRCAQHVVSHLTASQQRETTWIST